MDAFPSGGRMINRGGFTIRMRLLTFHDHSHTLDETMDNIKNHRCCDASLVLRESVNPLKDSLNVLLSESLLYKFDYIAVSKVTHQREQDSLDRP